MGEAKRRAERRREAAQSTQPGDTPKYASKVPKLVAVYVSTHIVEQVERRLSMTTYGRQEFIDQILEAGVAWFDMELDNLAKTKSEKPQEPLIVPAVSLPPGLAEAAARLDELKRGRNAAGVVRGAR